MNILYLMRLMENGEFVVNHLWKNLEFSEEFRLASTKDYIDILNEIPLPENSLYHY